MTKPNRITGRAVVEFVAMRFDVSPDDLIGPRRNKKPTRARQFAMFAMKTLCPHLSYPAIGRVLGGRDHTTILHGCRKIEELIAAGEFADDLGRLSEWFDHEFLTAQIVDAEQRLESLRTIQKHLTLVSA